jgi:peptide deformylase
VILPVVTYGNQVLKEPSKPVGTVTPEIRELVSSMLESMYAARGVGLAAEQVGRTECIAVIDVPKDMEDADCVEPNAAVPMPLVLIDPEITETKGALRRPEGCLSFPDLYVDITRARTVTFRCTNLAGERVVHTAHGLLARAVQHEIDHLHGVLMVDRMSTAQRLANAGKLKRIRMASNEA